MNPESNNPDANIPATNIPPTQGVDVNASMINYLLKVYPQLETHIREARLAVENQMLRAAIAGGAPQAPDAVTTDGHTAGQVIPMQPKDHAPEPESEPGSGME